MPIFNLMEDAATAEISRSQVWQWIRSPKGVLDDGRKVTKAMVAAMIPEEMAKIRELLGRGVRRGPLRRGGEDLRGPRRQRPLRRVPDAAGVRADRLAASRRRIGRGRRTRADRTACDRLRALPIAHALLGNSYRELAQSIGRSAGWRPESGDAGVRCLCWHPAAVRRPPIGRSDQSKEESTMKP